MRRFLATGLPSNATHWQVTHFTAEEAIDLMDEGTIDAADIQSPNGAPGELSATNLELERAKPARRA